MRWSVDGRHLYFTWNPERADVPELYTLPVGGGTPTKVPYDKRRFVVPDTARFNRDRTAQVYDLFGDIFVVTLADGQVRQITSTDAAERNPHFTFDGKAVTFERDNNLFASDLTTGLVRQITNFRTGRDPDEDPKGTDQQEYLEKQQMRSSSTCRRRIVSTRSERPEKRSSAAASIRTTSKTASGSPICSSRRTAAS